MIFKGGAGPGLRRLCSARRSSRKTEPTGIRDILVQRGVSDLQERQDAGVATPDEEGGSLKAVKVVFVEAG